jgi:hypothetical protein
MTKFMCFAVGLNVGCLWVYLKIGDKEQAMYTLVWIAILLAITVAFPAKEQG